MAGDWAELGGGGQWEGGARDAVVRLHLFSRLFRPPMLRQIFSSATQDWAMSCESELSWFELGLCHEPIKWP